MRQTDRRLMILLVFAAFTGGLILVPASAPPADAPTTGRLADQAALKPYGSLVGEWRGAGMVERGKTKGAWSEQAEWAWKLTPDSAALEAKIPTGKYLKSLGLRPGPRSSTFAADAFLADDTKRAFSGQGEEGKP